MDVRCPLSSRYNHQHALHLTVIAIPVLFRQQLQGETLKRVNTFTYLGSTLAEDGELDAEVTHRVQSGWKNWKRVSGLLCLRRMNMKIKGKVYRTVVRPALMYGQRHGR